MDAFISAHRAKKEIPGVVMDEEPEENSSGEERKEEVDEAGFDTKISTLVPIDCLIKTLKSTRKRSESDEMLEAFLFTSISFISQKSSKTPQLPSRLCSTGIELRFMRIHFGQQHLLRSSAKVSKYISSHCALLRLKKGSRSRTIQ